MVKDNSVPVNIKNTEVASVFDSYSPQIRLKMRYLRRLILETAASIDGVGEIEETLKWGEPSYSTSTRNIGSTIRIHHIKTSDKEYAMFFKCTANLVIAFRNKYPTEFKYGGNRSIIFDIDDEIPVSELKNCIALALTYHRNKHLDATTRWNGVERQLLGRVRF